MFVQCTFSPLRYSTVFTMFPIFTMVLDKDVSPEIAMTYPELYKELTKVGIGFDIIFYREMNAEL